MANIAKYPKISLIAAISKDRRALGFKGNLLWKIEGDLPRFKKITTGHPIIMGRKTHEAIGRPLPNRTNIVITKSGLLSEIEGLEIVGSVVEALELARSKDKNEIFIIGGGQVYNATIDQANRLYLTIVDDEPGADVFFPEYTDFKKEVSREDHSEHSPPFTYVILEK